MSKDLNTLLDRCIDRINAGESLKECLADYPEQAGELKPLLRAMGNLRDTCATMPGATARAVTRRRLDAALVNSERSLQKRQRRATPFWRATPFFGWSRIRATVSAVLVLALVGFGLYSVFTPGEQVVAQTNFRLLLSDEENAIGDFESLEITVTSIGMLRSGDGGGWEVIELEPSIVIDLTPLQGLNAQEVWNGILPEGEYIQVFIYIDEAIGTLENGDIVNVVVPSGNLQISKPFTITADDPVVSFVYDVTVVAAGGEYILLPQIDQSGADQPYHEVGEGQLTIWVIDPEAPTPVTPGEEITVIVTLHGDPLQPVSGAEVRVNGEHYGNTNGDGLISFPVPIAKELKIKAKVGTGPDELEGQLRIDFGDELTLEVVDGVVAPGNPITILVTFETLQGGTIIIEGAQVEVNDEDIGETDVNGIISFPIPFDDELEIEAELNELKGELEYEFEDELTLEVVDADTLEAIAASDVTPGMSVKVLVTFEGSPVEDATVTVEDVAGSPFTTDGGGLTSSFEVPSEEELKIKAELGELDGKLKIEFEGEPENNSEEQEAQDDGSEDELTLEIVAGTVAPGESITVLVTSEGSPVEGATITVNDTELDEKTDANGLISFNIPTDDELRIEAELGELDGKLKIEFSTGD